MKTGALGQSLVAICESAAQARDGRGGEGPGVGDAGGEGGILTLQTPHVRGCRGLGRS